MLPAAASMRPPTRSLPPGCGVVTHRTHHATGVDVDVAAGVLHRGWSPEEFARFVADFMIDALLSPAG